jgi:hypothetical protein
MQPRTPTASLSKVRAMDCTAAALAVLSVAAGCSAEGSAAAASSSKAAKVSSSGPPACTSLLVWSTTELERDRPGFGAVGIVRGERGDFGVFPPRASDGDVGGLVGATGRGRLTGGDGAAAGVERPDPGEDGGEIVVSSDFTPRLM